MPIALAGAGGAELAVMSAFAVIGAVLLLALVVSLVILAERSLKRHRGSGLKREKNERNALSRMAVGLARWGGGGGGSGGAS